MRSAIAFSLLAAVACGGDDGGGGGPDGGPDAGLDADLGTIVEPGDPGAADVRVDVRVDRDRKTISPLIYGVNGGADVARDRPRVQRSGGNRLTAYNWENNASNAGSDYCFQNDRYVRRARLDAGQRLPRHPRRRPRPRHRGAGDGADRRLRRGRSRTTSATPARARRRAAATCATRARTTCRRASRQTKRARARVLADARRQRRVVYQDEFVNWVKAGWGAQNVLFSLDNEPDLWSDTHAEIHPAQLTYVELVTDRTTTRSRRDQAHAGPPLRDTGFVSYGYDGYINLQNAPDRAARASSSTTSSRRCTRPSRPKANGSSTTSTCTGTRKRLAAARASSAPAPARPRTARVQAPRSLWDTTYVEDELDRELRRQPGHSRCCRG